MSDFSEEASQILRELKSRGVRALCHFTTLDNAASIIRMGALYSQQTLRQMNIPADIQDLSRFEGFQYLNLSIQQPNWKLWQKFARTKMDQGYNKRWCLFLINPEVCARAGVKFTTANATAWNVRRAGTAEGVEGLRALFGASVVDCQGMTLRPAGLAPAFPTSEQAEVLCPEPISIAETSGIIVMNEADKTSLCAVVPVNPALIRVNWRSFPALLRQIA
ncbi:MAG: DUF4433 domain-containing protein [Kiritimatiellae bacterium]|nr:DUF4433 domain-containing protein [Kiritimatiellia bacterium]